MVLFPVSAVINGAVTLLREASGGPASEQGTGHATALQVSTTEERTLRGGWHVRVGARVFGRTSARPEAPGESPARAGADAEDCLYCNRCELWLSATSFSKKARKGNPDIQSSVSWARQVQASEQS